MSSPKRAKVLSGYFTGFDVDPRLLRQILDGHPGLIRQAAEWGWSDTEVREQLAGVLPMPSCAARGPPTAPPQPAPVSATISVARMTPGSGRTQQNSPRECRARLRAAACSLGHLPEEPAASTRSRGNQADLPFRTSAAAGPAEPGPKSRQRRAIRYVYYI